MGSIVWRKISILALVRIVSAFVILVAEFVSFLSNFLVMERILSIAEFGILRIVEQGSTSV